MKYRILTITAIFVLLASACRQKNYYTIKGEAHGTTYSIIYEGKPDDLTKTEIDSLTSAFDKSLSTYIPNSVISKFNQSQKGAKTDSLLEHMYLTANKVYEDSEGAFDITVGPLVNIYGFGYTEKNEQTDSTIIDSVLQYIGMDKIRLKNNFLHKSHPLIEIDGNAIAKGLSADHTANYIKNKGIKDFLAEIGGEIVAAGNKYNRNWIVGIDKPEEGNFEPGARLQAKIKLKDKALATSGNYRRYYEKNGKKYVHTIDPKTGLPIISKLLSVTITAPDCVTADAYATACMALGLEKSKALINSNPDLEALFISADSEGKFITHMTKGMKKMVIN